jgi:hypothetical protein
MANELPQKHRGRWRMNQAEFALTTPEWYLGSYASFRGNFNRNRITSNHNVIYQFALPSHLPKTTA